MAAKVRSQLVEALVQGSPATEPGFEQAAAWLRGDGGLEGVGEALAEAAIEAAVRTQQVALLQGLEGGPKALRKAARAGLHRLRSAGVSVPEATAGRAFVLGAEVVRSEGQAWMSVDVFRGEAMVLLVWTDAEGSCALLGRLLPTTGLVDLEHAHLSRNAGRGLVRDLQARVGGLTEVPFVEALHLAQDGVSGAAAAGEGELPHEWEHFIQHVPAAVRQQAQATDPAGPLPERWDAALLAESLHLLEGEPRFYWPVSQQAIEAVLGSFAEGSEAPAEGQEAADAAAPAPTGDPMGEGEAGADSFDLAEQRHASAMARGVEHIFDDAVIQAGWRRAARTLVVVHRARSQAEKANAWRNVLTALERGVDPLELPLTAAAVEGTLLADYARAQVDAFDGDGVEGGRFEDHDGRDGAGAPLHGHTHDHSHDHHHDPL